MPRQADTGGSSGAPFAKLNTLGDRIIGAFAGGKSRQQTNYDTKAPLFKTDGKPKLQEVMWFIAMPDTTAFTGDPETPNPITPGDQVRFAVDGYKWGQVIEQRKQLPPHAGFPAGVSCSGDIYTIELTGWSAETKNPEGARKAGFTVDDKRIVILDQPTKDRYVLAQSRTGGNTNPAKDLTITIRRPNDDDKRWVQAADELFDTKPWEQTGQAMAHSAPGYGGQGETHETYDEEPF